MVSRHNVALFEQIKGAIRSEYKRMNMWVWQKRTTAESGPKCGTVGCIAGWAEILSKTGGKTTPEAIRDITIYTEEDNYYGIFDTQKAGNLLGLSRIEEDVLFDPLNWPREWRDKVDATEAGTEKHGEVVCDAIDAFLANPREFVYPYAEEQGLEDDIYD